MVKKMETLKTKETSEEEKKVQTTDDFKVGYIVALKEDGNFLFELIGKQHGLVELLGLHKYAEGKVLSILNKAQGTGDVLMHELGGLIFQLSSKVEKIIKAVVKPENEL